MDFANFYTRYKLLSKLQHRLQVAYTYDCASIVVKEWLKKFPDDKYPSQVLSATKQWLLNPTITNEWNAGNAARYAPHYIPNAVPSYAAYAACSVYDAPNYAAAAAESVSGSHTAKRLYVMLKGPAYAFDERWLTSDVVALVKGIVMDDAFDRMPILADALQDAGFDDVEVLTQLQTEQCGLSHWIIWNVMGWGK